MAIVVAGEVYDSITAACTAIGVKKDTARKHRKKHNLSWEEALEHYVYNIVDSGSVWTDDEIRILEEKYPSSGPDIPELLNYHTRNAIARRAYILGIKRNCGSGSGSGSGSDRGSGSGSSGSGSYHVEYVTFHGDKVALAKVLQYYGIKYSSIYQAIKQSGLSYQEFVDRVQRMHRVEDGKWVETVTSYFRDLREYISAEGLLWSPTYYIEYFKPGWSFKYFQKIKLQNNFTAQEATDFLSGPRKRVNYSETEDSIILENDGNSLEFVAKMLPNRSVLSVRNRAVALGVNLTNIKSDNPRNLVRMVKDIERVSFAYDGTDGHKYMFVKCKVCGRVLLMRGEKAGTFEHNDIQCEHLATPSYFWPPTYR